MIFDQLVEGVEFDHPQEEFAGIVTENFEVLNTVHAFDREREVSGRAFAHTNEESTFVLI